MMKKLIIMMTLVSSLSWANDIEHLGGSAVLSFGSCLIMNAFTNMEQPWFGAVTGFALSMAFGVLVEADQGFVDDYKKDLVLDATGNAIGTGTCYALSYSVKRERDKKAVRFLPGPAPGVPGAAIEWRF